MHQSGFYLQDHTRLYGEQNIKGTILCCYPAVSKGKRNFKTHDTGDDTFECLSVPKTDVGNLQCQWNWKRTVLYRGSTVWKKKLRVAIHRKHTHTHTHTLAKHARIHFVVRLMTDPQPLPKPVLHIVRSSAPSLFPASCPFLSSSSSRLRLLPRLPVTSILPPITCLRRQFVRKMWPIQLALHLFTVYRMSLSTLPLFNTSFFTGSFQMIFSILLQSPQFKIFPTFIYLYIYIYIYLYIYIDIKSLIVELGSFILRIPKLSIWMYLEPRPFTDSSQKLYNPFYTAGYCFTTSVNFRRSFSKKRVPYFQKQPPPVYSLPSSYQMRYLHMCVCNIFCRTKKNTTYKDSKNYKIKVGECNVASRQWQVAEARVMVWEPSKITKLHNFDIIQKLQLLDTLDGQL